MIAPILQVLPNFPIPATADSNITVELPVNLTATNYYGVAVSVPVRIRPWWNTFNNVTAFYNRFTGNVGNAPLNEGVPTVYVRSNHAFTFKNAWAAELSANFFSERRSGYAVFRSQVGIACGVQKSFWEGNATLRLTANDIFRTRILRFAATYEGTYRDQGTVYRDTRVAHLSFTYRFGNKKVQGAQKRTTAGEEESSRM